MLIEQNKETLPWFSPYNETWYYNRLYVCVQISIFIFKNYETGFYRRFAFIKMKDHAGIEKVLNHDEHVIDNTKVLVLSKYR